MLLGVIRIIARINQSDEHSLYRETEDGMQYFLFSATAEEEIVKHGAFLAQLLGVPFRNTFNYDYSAEGFKAAGLAAPIENRAKKKRVSGVAKTCKPLIAEGKTDEEIFQIMLPKYLEANRTEKEARELLIPYLKDMRAGKY